MGQIAIPAELREEYVVRQRERPWSVYPLTCVPAILPFHTSNAEIRVLAGPNRGGKTTAGAFELVSYATGLNVLREEEYETPNLTWGVCLDFQSTPGRIMLAKLRETLPPGYKYYKQDHIIKLPKPWYSEIHIKSQEEGREHFYGGAPLAVWMDEGKGGETGNENFSEILIRRSPQHPLYIYMTLTHLNGHDWLYQRLLDEKSKDYIKGTHLTKFNIDDVTVEKGGFWSAKDVQAFKLAYSELEVQARFYTGFFPFESRPFFSMKQLLEAMERAPKGKTVNPTLYASGNAVMEDSPSGKGTLYRPKESGHSYLAAWDPASGGGHDSSALWIMDRHDLTEVFNAKRSDMDPESFYQNVVYPACLYFNTALLAPETNGQSGGAAVSACRSYPNLYYAKDWKKATATFTENIGWQTNSATRDKILDSLTRTLRENKWTPSEALLQEMAHVVVKRKADGKTKVEHADGFHDDLVMAAGIALTIHYEEPAIDWSQFGPGFSKLRVRYGQTQRLQTLPFN